jgi:hypothetical protein
MVIKSKTQIERSIMKQIALHLGEFRITEISTNGRYHGYYVFYNKLFNPFRENEVWFSIPDAFNPISLDIKRVPYKGTTYIWTGYINGLLFGTLMNSIPHHALSKCGKHVTVHLHITTKNKTSDISFQNFKKKDGMY